MNRPNVFLIGGSHTMVIKIAAATMGQKNKVHQRLHMQKNISAC